MNAKDWQEIKAIGSKIVVAAACMDYREGKSEIERREVEAMKARVKALAHILGMTVVEGGAAGRPSPDDWFIWPDGTMATRGEIDRGEFDHMSDDFRQATQEEVAAMEQSE